MRKWLVMIAILGASGMAHAERPTLVGELGVGVGAPLGIGSLALGVAPVRWLELTAGGGWAEYGTQLGAMLRLRSKHDRGLAFGVSRGHYEHTPYFFATEANDYGETTWVNGELYSEHGVGASFVRFSFGLARTVDIETRSYRNDPVWAPYLNVTIGFRR